MPPRISPEQWRPSEGITLDCAGQTVVRSENNALVVAGPGAGKTELLAQRASYLLQTNLCPVPRRILALSFKRDAADNLRERVERRCGPELAHRLDSLTFDAFAKSLVDRFREAIPAEHRPTADYQIAFLKEAEEDLTDVLDARTQRRGERRNLLDKLFVLHGALPHPFSQSLNAPDLKAAALLWQRFMARTPTRLTFPMITRLAALALRSKPAVLRALRATYSHVFLDEYQDTTEAQYDLVCATFRGTDTVLTAVGDNKQRIMVFAGAMVNAFQRFEADFTAERVPLIINHRSAPRLVQIQQVLANQIDPAAARVNSGKPALEGECEIWEFAHPVQEAEVIADRIAGWIHDEGLEPRQICILVKQLVRRYASDITQALDVRGIKARDESEYQDLMAEPATRAIIGYLELLVRESAPAAWSEITSLLIDLRGYHADTPAHKVRTLEAALARFLEGQRRVLRAIKSDAADGQARFQAVIDALFQRMLGEEHYRQLHPQYLQGGWFEQVCKSSAKLLWLAFTNVGDWAAVIDQFLGVGIIPIMTVHKSKGLEYDTALFVGLEDDAFWRYTDQQADDDCAFFVALSRAKRRMYFTFSEQRGTGYEGAQKRQSCDNIRLLREVLEQAHVPVVNYRRQPRAL